MEEQEQNILQEPQPKRSAMLTVLCILTFVGSGMNLVSSLVIFLFFDAFKVVAANLAKTFNLPGMEMLTGGPSIFFGVTALIYAAAIVGSVYMWQLKKLGFHIYTISQILLVVAPMYFFKLPGPGVMDILLAGAFVLLYSMNLKTMS